MKIASQPVWSGWREEQMLSTRMWTKTSCLCTQSLEQGGVIMLMHFMLCKEVITVNALSRLCFIRCSMTSWPESTRAS